MTSVLRTEDRQFESGRGHVLFLDTLLVHIIHRKIQLNLGVALCYARVQFTRKE